MTSKNETPRGQKVKNAILIVDLIYTLIRAAKIAKLKEKDVINLIKGAWENA